MANILLVGTLPEPLLKALHDAAVAIDSTLITVDLELYIQQCEDVGAAICCKNTVPNYENLAMDIVGRCSYFDYGHDNWKHNSHFNKLPISQHLNKIGFSTAIFSLYDLFDDEFFGWQGYKFDPNLIERIGVDYRACGIPHVFVCEPQLADRLKKYAPQMSSFIIEGVSTYTPEKNVSETPFFVHKSAENSDFDAQKWAKNVLLNLTYGIITNGK